MANFSFRLFLFFIFVRLGLSITPRSNGIKGKATYYIPDGNAGACGKEFHQKDFVLALSQRFQNKHGKLCWRKVEIKRGSKVARGMVVDTCPGCEMNHIDLSPALFKEFGKLEEGSIPVTWRIL